MPFSGKWHLLSLTACLAAWAVAGDQPVVLLLLLGYGFYLVLGRYYRMLTALVAVSLIIVLDVIYFQSRSTVLSAKQSNFTGKVETSPVFDGDQLTFILRTEPGELVKTYVQLSSLKMKQKLYRSLRPGVICSLSGQLEKPSKASNFHAFDNRIYLADQHIFWQLQAHGPPRFLDTPVSPVDRLRQFRQDQIERIQSMFPPGAAAMMNALIFGEDTGLDPDLESAYQLFGIVHLLVVSGMHITVIFGCLFFAASRIGIVRGYISLLFLMIIPLYVLITGAEPSITRSGLTAGLFFAAGLVRMERLRSTDLISIACMLMIIYDPYVVFDPGFELSFTVTFVILIAAPLIATKYSSSVIRLFVLSIVSELAALPIVVTHFYQLSLIGFFIGIFFVPYITLIILPLSIISYLAGTIFPLFVPFLSFIFEQLIGLPHRGLIYLYQHPVFQLDYGALSPLMTIVAVLIIGSSFLLWERWNTFWTSGLLFFSFLIIYGIIVLADIANPYGTVTFLDVGQGDSILIRLPHRGGNLLIDSGGTIPYPQADWQKKRKPFEVGRDVDLHEMRALGISSLDVVVMTHRDYDHIGGMKGIVGQIPIKKMMTNPYFDPNEADQNLFRKAIRTGTRLLTLKSGQTIEIGGTVFKVLSPSSRSDSNNNSLVIEAVLGGKRWLFTGDMGTEGEKRLLNHYPSVRADILKLGHHGSRTSSSDEFLDKLNPAIAIVSCGKNNRYGHPHPETIKRLNKRHIAILRTDRSGAIRFTFSKTKIVKIETAIK
ncbi:DNA internalization-related competence protein ComEC/Rec2 [Sporolactobacillus sp. THM7-4]|nr:DNA internalization-related competence protein ComEC/Rec2 [Sporolactobacillus sp. THM7-4]